MIFKRRTPIFKSLSICQDTYEAINFSLPKFKSEVRKMLNIEELGFTRYLYQRLLKWNQSRSKDLERYASHYVNHDMFPYNQPTSPWRYRDSKSLKYVRNFP